MARRQTTKKRGGGRGAVKTQNESGTNGANEVDLTIDDDETIVEDASEAIKEVGVNSEKLEENGGEQEEETVEENELDEEVADDEEEEVKDEAPEDDVEENEDGVEEEEAEDNKSKKEKPEAEDAEYILEAAWERMEKSIAEKYGEANPFRKKTDPQVIKDEETMKQFNEKLNTKLDAKERREVEKAKNTFIKRKETRKLNAQLSHDVIIHIDREDPSQTSRRSRKPKSKRAPHQVRMRFRFCQSSVLISLGSRLSQIFLEDRKKMLKNEHCSGGVRTDYSSGLRNSHFTYLQVPSELEPGLSQVLKFAHGENSRLSCKKKTFESLALTAFYLDIGFIKPKLEEIADGLDLKFVRKFDEKELKHEYENTELTVFKETDILKAVKALPKPKFLSQAPKILGETWYPGKTVWGNTNRSVQSDKDGQKGREQMRLLKRARTASDDRIIPDESIYRKQSHPPPGYGFNQGPPAQPPTTPNGNHNPPNWSASAPHYKALENQGLNMGGPQRQQPPPQPQRAPPPVQQPPIHQHQQQRPPVSMQGPMGVPFGKPPTMDLPPAHQRYQPPQQQQQQQQQQPAPVQHQQPVPVQQQQQPQQTQSFGSWSQQASRTEGTGQNGWNVTQQQSNNQNTSGGFGSWGGGPSKNNTAQSGGFGSWKENNAPQRKDQQPSGFGSWNKSESMSQPPQKQQQTQPSGWSMMPSTDQPPVTQGTWRDNTANRQQSQPIPQHFQQQQQPPQAQRYQQQQSQQPPQQQQQSTNWGPQVSQQSNNGFGSWNTRAQVQSDPSPFQNKSFERVEKPDMNFTSDSNTGRTNFMNRWQ